MDNLNVFCFFGGVFKYLVPECFARKSRLSPRGGWAVLPGVMATRSHASIWLHVTSRGGHPQSCFHLASCHQPWSPLGESAHLAPPQELSTGEPGALSSHADLCPEDRSLCGRGWLFPAPPESMVFVPRLPASPGWEPGRPAPG